MSYGVFVDGRRPKSKKQVKDVMGEDPKRVRWQNDSLYGETAGKTFRGDDLPEGLDDTFVGPDPHTDRRWYGQIKVKEGKVTIK